MYRRSYTELSQITDFEDRFQYLSLHSVVARPTFGFDRYINQRFYQSREWKHIRDKVIARDLGMDLGVEGYEIYDRIIIHHMNPMDAQNIVESDLDNLNPEYLITTTHQTHNAIHYGDLSLVRPVIVQRKPGDTKLW